ncbi:ABC transporter permease [bacterium]|nr:MAG: ABC transporter permease [bacterium]
MSGWLREQSRTYFDNAQTARDYRSGMRGNKGPLVFGLYLLALIVAALMFYSQNTSQAMSVVEAQGTLRNFYRAVIGMLAAMVALITPALSATAIVQERLRHSLDLVFSAPVPPKYLLVGKMLSAYRYTWMLLILSLPVTAASVVLGGASWSDVLGAYVLLSAHALIFTSVALFLGTLAPKPVSAILWSYGFVILYCSVTAMIGFASAFTRGFGGSSAGMEASWLATLNPFLVMETSASYTMVGTMEVPNILFTIVFALLVSKLALLAAGAVLSPYGGKEVYGLRIHGLLYLAGLGAIASPGAMRIPGMAADTDILAGMTLNWILLLLFPVLPFITCYGYEGERRYWPNGPFSIRRMLDGTPAGGLPFLIASILAVAGGSAAASAYAGNALGPTFLMYVAYALGFWTFFWSIGRLASSALLGAKTARTSQFCVFVVIAFLPAPFLASVISNDFAKSYVTLWDVWPLHALMSNDAAFAFKAAIVGFVMGVLGLILAFVSEISLKRRLQESRGNTKHGLPTAA